MGKSLHDLLKRHAPVVKEPALPQEKRFRLMTGKELSSIMELYQELTMMPDETFSFHVTTYKNDFADWIKHVLKHYDAAERLRGILDKTQFTRALQKEMILMQQAGKQVKSFIRPNYGFIGDNKAQAIDENQFILAIIELDQQQTALSAKLDSSIREIRLEIEKITNSQTMRHELIIKEMNRLELFEKELEQRAIKIAQLEKDLMNKENAILQNGHENQT